MSIYQIRIHYSTGDSFNTYNEEQVLEYEWKNLNIVKENLKRIKNHYDWYSNGTFAPHKSDWQKNIPKFCVQATSFKVTSKYDYAIKLLHDDGEREYQLYPFWIGYFEHLYSAEIIIKEDESLKFYTHWIV